MLIFIAPQLARFALKFGDYEYFWLAVLGLAMSALVSMGQTSKGLLSAALGMFVSTVGPDQVSYVSRYTFGNVDAKAGLAFHSGDDRHVRPVGSLAERALSRSARDVRRFQCGQNHDREKPSPRSGSNAGRC